MDCVLHNRLRSRSRRVGVRVVAKLLVRHCCERRALAWAAAAREPAESSSASRRSAAGSASRRISYEFACTIGFQYPYALSRSRSISLQHGEACPPHTCEICGRGGWAVGQTQPRLTASTCVRGSNAKRSAARSAAPKITLSGMAGSSERNGHFRATCSMVVLSPCTMPTKAAARGATPPCTACATKTARVARRERTRAHAHERVQQYANAYDWQAE